MIFTVTYGPLFLMVPKNNNVSLLRYSLSCEIANQAKL